ncbi:hypothetical protein QCA50_017798 [Cerrena zonata]|uniref:Uncharacterized protein n=1 Tax=Cerrena zonata TaxID=2478898 RepID=A0AAW0FJK7_9APHY
MYEALKGLPTHRSTPVAIIAKLIINARRHSGDSNLQPKSLITCTQRAQVGFSAVRVETALYRHDEQYPVLVGWLISTLQGAYESLACWIALLILQQSSSETQKEIANLKELFKDGDYFLSLIILHDNQVPKAEPQPGPEHHDTNTSGTSLPPVQDNVINHRNASAVVSVTTHRMVKLAGRQDIWLLQSFIIDFVPTTIL